MSQILKKKKNSAFTPDDPEGSGRTGFTLVEMLIVTMIFSVVGLALFTTLNSGITIWQRLNQAGAEEDVSLVFERIARDLRNAFKFESIDFQGSKDKIVSGGLVIVDRLSKTLTTTVGQVIYYYDSSSQELKREEKNYSQIYKERDGAKTILLKGVNDLTFTYYSINEEDGMPAWEPEWKNEGLPLAVRIELEFLNDDTDETQKFVKTVDIPNAGI